MQRKKVIPSMNYSDPKMIYLNRFFEEESSMLNACQKYALTFIFKVVFFLYNSVFLKIIIIIIER
jgi:hypothetical protein